MKPEKSQTEPRGPALFQKANAMSEEHPGNPDDVLDVLRDVLLKHMDRDDFLDEYRIQSAVYIGRNSGRLMSEDNIISGHDVPGGLRLTMRSGHEYDLTLDFSHSQEEEED
jgi:hypothetical protein